MSFCVFGNVTIAARHAQSCAWIKTSLNHWFWCSPWEWDEWCILWWSKYIQDGSYPGTCKIDELGHGDGEGTFLNLPLQRGSGDIAISTVFDEVIVPSAQRFKPDIFLASAGYDGPVLDPLGSLWFTTGTCSMLASNIKQLAKDLWCPLCVFLGGRIQPWFCFIFSGGLLSCFHWGEEFGIWVW